jgi:hypothetical protein
MIGYTYINIVIGGIIPDRTPCRMGLWKIRIVNKFNIPLRNGFIQGSILISKQTVSLNY